MRVEAVRVKGCFVFHHSTWRSGRKCPRRLWEEFELSSSMRSATSLVRFVKFALVPAGMMSVKFATAWHRHGAHSHAQKHLPDEGERNQMAIKCNQMAIKCNQGRHQKHLPDEGERNQMAIKWQSNGNQVAIKWS